MKKILLLISVSLIVFNSSLAQTKPTAGSAVGLFVPKFCGSGDSTRLPIIFNASVNALIPGAKYKYITKFITIADTSSTSNNPGSGNSMFLTKNSSWVYTTGPSLSTSGNHDTFTATNLGNYTGWFGGIYSSNSRFTPGNYIYPIIAYQKIDTGTQEIKKVYLQDSIKVLAFSSSAGANNGTGIYGTSYAKAKNLVLLYDTLTPFSNRPISITYVESEGQSVVKTPYWYTTFVNGSSGSWGTIVPNTLSKGIKKIEHRDLTGDSLVYANTETDATWGPDSTKNPKGGTVKPIKIQNTYAPLVAPKIEFAINNTTVAESNTTLKLVVKRFYGNNDSTKVSSSVVAGSASTPSDYSYNNSKPLVFKPYGEVTDTIRVNIFDDNLSEANEDIAIKLNSAVNGAIGVQTTHTINITDNDIPTIFFTSKGVTVNEAAGTIKVRVKMTTGSASPTSFKVAVKTKSDSTFIPADFKIGTSNTDTTIQFAGGKVTDSLDFTVRILDEQLKEDRNDTIVMVIRQPTSPAKVGKDSLFTLVIIDNDAPPVYSFASKSKTVKETDGSVKIRINIAGRNNNQSDISLRYLASRSTTTEGNDLTFNPTSKLFNIAKTDPDSIIVTVPILDNGIFEKTETATFVISVQSNAKIGLPDTFKIIIQDDDLPEYNISKITSFKTNTGVVDSLNVKCRIRGSVHGINMRPIGTPSGFQYTIIDGTGGIRVQSILGNKGASMTEGDSVLITGTVGQIDGMAYLQSIDTVIKLGSGTIRNPLSVNVLNETTESKLVRLNLVTLVDASQWPSTALSANTTATVKVKNQNDTFTVLIDSDTDIDGTPAPTGFLNITGLGGQIDATNPYTSNYMIFPRRLTDITKLVVPEFSFTTTSSQTAEYRDSTVGFFLVGNNLTNNQQITIEIKGGTASRNTDYQSNLTRTFILTPSKPSTFVKVKLNDDILSEQPETIIWVIRGNAYGTIIGPDSVHTITIIDDETVRVNQTELEKSVVLYPNPAKNFADISSSSEFQSIEVVDINGKLLTLNVDINGLNAHINTESLNSGIYLINIRTEKGSVVKTLNISK